MSEIDQALTQSLIDLSKEHDERLSGLEQSLSELLKAASERSDQDDTLSQQLKQLAERVSQLADSQSQLIQHYNSSMAAMQRYDARLKALETRT